MTLKRKIKKAYDLIQGELLVRIKKLRKSENLMYEVGCTTMGEEIVIKRSAAAFVFKRGGMVYQNMEKKM